MSTLTAFDYIAEGSDATPGLFNRIFSQLSDNIGNVNGSASVNLSGFSITVPSTTSNYLYFQDSLGQKSSYIIGSQVGGTADGLNIWDASGNTLIASFSKQSVRFYQNVVGPVFDTGGALTSTLNAGTIGTGADSKETRIQAAIIAASQQGLARVYVPANMYPYSASSISFINTVQMVREGGDQSVYDVRAYGASGDSVHDDRPSFQPAVDAALAAGGAVFVPSGIYSIGTSNSSDGYFNGVVVNSYINAGSSPRNRIKMYGTGISSILRASTASMVILRWSAERCELAGLTLDGNSNNSVVGLGLMGPNSNSTIATDNEDNNDIHDLFIANCATGMYLRASGAGLVAYNRVTTCNFTNNTYRAVHITDALTTTAPRANRNTFIGCVVSGPGNTGVDIQRGDTNQFVVCHFQDILSGTTPCATPTAFRIQAGDSDQNQYTNLVSCMFEGNTRDLENANRRTKVWGGTPAESKISGLANPGFDALAGAQDITTRFGQLIVGAQDSDTELTFGPGYIVFPTAQNASANSQTLDDYEEGNWTPVPSALSTTGSPTYTGQYTKIGRMVYCTMLVVASTTSSTANVTSFTGLPFTPTTISTCAAASGAVASYGIGLVYTDGHVYTPTWPAVASVILSFHYFTAT